MSQNQNEDQQQLFCCFMFEDGSLCGGDAYGVGACVCKEHKSVPVFVHNMAVLSESTQGVLHRLKVLEDLVGVLDEASPEAQFKKAMTILKRVGDKGGGPYGELAKTIYNFGAIEAARRQKGVSYENEGGV